ncbi:hypothetical protein ACFY2W_15655 [Streptomyces sp. NPDC001262]|uniref:hypothetical protein n=1 Tax=Streptomyces sp. NPDC001262 TaxID=3364552 RepID=UPI00368515CC
MRNLEDIATTRLGITMTSYTASREASCSWSGTAPFCGGECPYGCIRYRTGRCGDGSCCCVGHKALCCHGGC